MCAGGGGGGNSDQQSMIAQQQMQQQADLSASQMREQQREFDATQAQTAATLANTKAQQDAQAADVAKQAALTDTWQKGQAAELARGTQSINKAFAQFTPDYYSKYTKAYVNNYAPQVNQQADRASAATTFGLARSGNLQSQTAASQIAENAQTKAQALQTINNAATAAATNERTNVLNAKQSLQNTVSSAATLGSPVTPGSADAIQANFNNTSSALSRLSNQAGDTVTTLAATPQYTSLGNIFGAAASGAAAVQAGTNSYNYGTAFNTGLGAGSATGGGSARIV